MRSCSLYQRGGRCIGAPTAMSNGAWFDSEPYEVIDAEASHEAIGAWARGLLALSRFWRDDELPRDFRKVTERLCAVAGVKSWSKFFEGSRHVFLQEADDGSLRVGVMRRGKGKSYDPHRTVELGTPDDTALGRAIVEAFAEAL